MPIHRTFGCLNLFRLNQEIIFALEAHVLHTADAPLPDGEKLRLGLWFKDHEIRLDEYRSLSINSTSETGVWQHLVVRGPAPADTREVLAVLEFSGCNQACSQLGAVLR